MQRHVYGMARWTAAALVAMAGGGASAQGAGAAPTTAAAREPGGAALDVDFAVGVQGYDVSGSREKFREYGQVTEGVVLDRLRLTTQRLDRGDFIELEIRSAREDDEAYRLTTGRQGAYRLSLEYDATPHVFASGPFLWGGVGTGRLEIADAVQSQLGANEQTQAERGPAATTNPNADTTGEDGIQQGIVRSLYAAARPVTFRLDRRRFGAALEVELPGAASAWIRVRNENRDGARQIGAGSYERWALGAAGLTHVEDRFVTLGAELAEPLDHRTFGLAAGAGIHREGWLADVEYTLTQFRNFEDVLLWDNPFRLDPATTAGAPAANAFDRSRFAVGQLVLPPDSLAHDVTASGAIDLPMHGRLGASVSYGIVTQDDPFQQYTRNTAIICPAATCGTATDTALADLPRPQRDLDGDVRTLAGSLSASVRPVQPLTVSARYRAYRYDGRSAEITFPAYAAFGESTFRNVKNDPGGGLAGAPVRNDVFDYWRHDADVGVDFRLTRALSVSAEAAWEGWRYDHLRLDRLDEYTLGAGVGVRPFREGSLRVTYRYGDRTSEGYLRGATAENPEARGLLNFNWADRTRHLVDARAQYAFSRMVSLGVIGRFSDEEYGGETEGGAVVDQFRFGRTDLTRWLGSFDVTVTPAERLSFQASYTHEVRTEKMALAAKDDAAKANDDFGGLGDAYAPENYWNSDIDETVDSFGLAVTIHVIPERVVLDAGYQLSSSDTDVDTFNPSPGVAAPGNPDTMLANAIANDWPTVKNRLHDVFADLGFRVTPQVRAGVRYVYESYDLDDFAWDVMDPYMAGRSVENSTRFVFADATYDAYRAHVGTAYVAGRF